MRKPDGAALFDTQMQWLRAILEKTELAPSTLSRKAGLASSTIIRKVNGQDRSLMTVAATTRRIATISGVPPGSRRARNAFRERRDDGERTRRCCTVTHDHRLRLP